MFATLKRWFSRDAAALPWADVEAWAVQAGHRFARAREGEGFIVDGSFAAPGQAPDSTPQKPWRLEWGPPQRAYIVGHELRIRMELGLPPSLQMLLMSQQLMDTLESEIFERSTQDLQTHIDMSTPEEMRWLSMFPKSPLAAQRGLRAHFSGVSNNPTLLGSWVADSFATRLEAAVAGVLKDGPPFVLMTLRGRLYLRVQLEQPTQPQLAELARLFEAAMHAAHQVAATLRADADGYPSVVSTAWQSQFPTEPPGA